MAILDLLKKFSAKTYLVGAFTIVATTPVIMLSLIQYNFIDNNLLSVVEMKNISVVKNLSNKITSDISLKMKMTNFIATQILNRGEEEVEDNFKRFNESFPEANLIYYNADSKKVLFQNGKSISETSEDSLDLKNYKFEEMSRNSQNSLFVESFVIDGKKEMAVLTPLYSGKNYKGYILMIFNHSKINQYVDETIEKTASTTIVNNETGNVIYPQKKDFKFNPPASFVLEQIKNKNYGLISRYFSHDRIEKMVSYSNLGEPNWLIWIEYPISNYQEEIRKSIIRTIIAATISWLFALGMGLWIAYYQHRFISNFLSSIREVAKGNYKKKVKSEIKLIPREFDSLIDEFNLMEEKIEQLDNFKSNLIDTVSHEFRTPLTSIKGFTSTLLRKDANFDADTQRKMLKIISSQSDRLSRMVEDLLVVPKLEGNVLKLNLQEVELEHTVEHISEFFPEEKYEINIRGQIWVMVDPDRFEQILLNLFENAHKYSNPKGSGIRVGGFQEDNYVHIVVANASENVPQDKIDSLFDKFVRLDDQLTRTTGGTGLGLYITKGLVELMNGKIWIESDNNEFRVNFTVPNADF